MSSHHFVREKQEPALIIANGESCSSELTGQLLEWNPFVVVLDRAILRVIDLKIKVDLLIGDFDRGLAIKEIMEHHFPVEIIHDEDQESTDLEKALKLLIRRGYPSVNIIWATGRRADHTIGNLTDISKYSDQINIVMYDDYSRIIVLPKSFEKWYTKGTPVSLIPIGTVKGIKTKGLKYELNNEELILGKRIGTSNETLTDGHMSISYDEGKLLLMECKDN